jgi:hypothetical protein
LGEVRIYTLRLEELELAIKKLKMGLREDNLGDIFFR